MTFSNVTLPICFRIPLTACARAPLSPPPRRPPYKAGTMSPTNEEGQHYQPKDTVHSTLREAAVFGGVGTLFAAVRSSLAKQNVGPWATFTKHGGLIVTFGIAYYPPFVFALVPRFLRMLTCLLVSSTQPLPVPRSPSAVMRAQTCARQTTTGMMRLAVPLRAL